VAVVVVVVGLVVVGLAGDGMPLDLIEQIGVGPGLVAASSVGAFAVAVAFAVASDQLLVHLAGVQHANLFHRACGNWRGCRQACSC